MYENTKTMNEFFNWLMSVVAPSHVTVLKDEWSRVPFKVIESLLRYEFSEWPALWDSYDERVGLMCEGRMPSDEELLLAWEDVLGVRMGAPDKKRTELKRPF